MKATFSALVSLFFLFAIHPVQAFGPDMNGDGFVDEADLMEVAQHWQPEASPEETLLADFTGDGSVNNEDILFFFRFWGQETPPRSFDYDWGARFGDFAVDETSFNAPATLTVSSFSGEGVPDVSGLVSLDVPDVTAPAFVTANNSQDEPVLLGFGLSETTTKLAASISKAKGRPFSLEQYTLKGTTPIPISAESTALSLCLLNPMLWGVSGVERAEFASYMKTRDDFQTLVQVIRSSLLSDPDDPLDDQKHPEVLETAAEISVLGLMEWSGGSMAKILGLDAPQKGLLTVEVLDDPSGNQPEVIFRNNVGVHFGGGAIPAGATTFESPSFLLGRVDSVISFHLRLRHSA